jgi:glycerol uptake facilitator-like aquaporin
MKLTAWTNLWVYLVGNFAGGAAAGLLFKALNKEAPAAE